MTTPNSESVKDIELQATEALNQAQSEVSDEDLQGAAGGWFTDPPHDQRPRPNADAKSVYNKHSDQKLQ